MKNKNNRPIKVAINRAALGYHRRTTLKRSFLIHIFQKMFRTARCFVGTRCKFFQCEEEGGEFYFVFILFYIFFFERCTEWREFDKTRRWVVTR